MLCVYVCVWHLNIVFSNHIISFRTGYCKYVLVLYTKLLGGYMYLKDVLLNSTLLYPFECTLCYGPILKACCACLCQLLWAASVFELSLSLCVCLYTIHVHLVYQKSSAYMYLNFIIGLVCRPARSCVCRQCMHTFALCTSLYDGSNVILNHTQKVYKQRGFLLIGVYHSDVQIATCTHPLNILLKKAN